LFASIVRQAYLIDNSERLIVQCSPAKSISSSSSLHIRLSHLMSLSGSLQRFWVIESALFSLQKLSCKSLRNSDDFKQVSLVHVFPLNAGSAVDTRKLRRGKSLTCLDLLSPGTIFPFVEIVFPHSISGPLERQFPF